MNDILEKIMNFINENTMLLIFICIFLIIILVIYLIDNTIKTRRLEKEELKNKQEEPIIINNEIPVKVEKKPVAKEAPVVEEPKAEDIPEETEIPEVQPEITIEEPEVNVEETKVEDIPEEPEITVTPVIDSNIDELLNKDYSMNNEIVNNIPTGPIEEKTSIPTPTKVEEPKSKYNNDKKLSDIFAKKAEPTVKKIETTQDFSDELDRILQKLNSEESRIEDESSDYTNMF